MSTIVLKLGRLFENVVELTNALKFRYSDLLTIGEPDFVSDKKKAVISYHCLLL